jgi:hypothetical protein
LDGPSLQPAVIAASASAAALVSWMIRLVMIGPYWATEIVDHVSKIAPPPS